MKNSLFTGILLIICVSVFGQNNNALFDVYEYPIKPGTPQWDTIKSNEAKKEALQIPELKIKRISTKGLVKTCLDYPFFMEVMFYNNFQDGFNHVVNSFNGLDELLKRQDASKYLMDAYKEIQITEVNNKNDLATQGRHSFKLMYLELILSQDTILSSLQEKEAKELVSESLKKYKAKKEQSKIYGNESLDVNIILIGKILQKNQYSFNKNRINDKHLSKVLDFQETIDENTYNEIIDGASKFINN